jgi:hypothetical protein
MLKLSSKGDPMTTATAILLIVAIIAIAAAAWLYHQREKTRQIRSRFGAEYDRLVHENRGSTWRAERELERRQERVARFRIRSLSPDERSRFADEWQRRQEQFVDDPPRAVAAADDLVTAAMNARGYPMGDFEQLAADISVDHPEVVDSYRQAHQIALRDRAGGATTEELRLAMVHYRRLFDNMLERPQKVKEEVSR